MKLNQSPLLCLLLLLPFSFVIAKDSAPSFSIANTLQSNMVIQQGKPLHIWGTTISGAEIIVKANWNLKTFQTKATNEGKWSIDIPVPNAIPGEFKKNKISIAQSKQVKELNNILIGDVWLCSGQSNMAMEIRPWLPWLLGANNFRIEIENANYPEIRLFKVRTDFKALPEEDCGGNWEVCSPNTAPHFSAVAYFFARQIFIKKKIPIGLVVSSVGASSCQAWTSRETLSSDSILNKKYLFPYDTSRLSKEQLDSVVTFEKVVRPTLFYNAMIYPLRNLNFTGSLWYQGESNRYDSSLYTQLCAKMIYNWRTLFKDKQLPFYLVQVAPYNWSQNDNRVYEYALLREAQSNIRKIVPHTEMASTMDISDPNDIHPRNKQDVGFRLAKIALANVYKERNTIFQGPEYLSHKIENNIIKISFSNTGSGLASNDGKEPKHFFIADEKGILYEAKASIEKDEVWLSSDKVKNPTEIRYAFTNYPVTNFENNEGFPAIPFRIKLK
jgi:sialate O-acetylesterase